MFAGVNQQCGADRAQTTFREATVGGNAVAILAFQLLELRSQHRMICFSIVNETDYTH